MQRGAGPVESVLRMKFDADTRVAVLAGIIANMNIYFQPTSLFNTLMMLALLAGGLGLVARSVRTH